MKLLFGCGIHFGFRGSKEHVFLETSNMTHGTFASGHPFAGCDWYGVEGLLDKTHKLSVHKDHVRSNENFMRTPLVNEDPTSSDFGGCIKRYLEKMSPGQLWMYCKVIPAGQRSVNADGVTSLFYANCPSGGIMFWICLKRAQLFLAYLTPSLSLPILSVQCSLQSFLTVRA